MAETPISALPVANSLADSDIGVFVVGGTTSRMAKSVLQTIMLSGPAAPSLAESDSMMWLISGAPSSMTWQVLQAFINNSVRSAGTPVNTQSADYTLVISDTGKCILHSTSDNAPRTVWIPTNGSVPFPVGTVVTFVNGANVLTIAPLDTCYMSGTGLTGNRQLSLWGVATALKIEGATWIISGTGLT